MSIIQDVIDTFPYEEMRKDNRNFCNECGRITESKDDNKECSICGSKREKETLLEKVMKGKEMSEFGRAYPLHPQIVEFLSDHWSEFLSREDCLSQIGKTFDVSRADAENVIDAVEAEMGQIKSTGREEVFASRKVSKKNEEQDGDFETLGSKLSKEDAERIARDKGGTVVVDDEEDSELYSVIKKKEERI